MGNGGGNLSAIAGGYLDDLRSFEVDTGATLGPDGAATEAGPGTTGDAVGLLARTYGTPSWLGLGEPIVYPGAVAPAPWPALLLPLVALATLATLSIRWRWTPGLAALGIASIGLLASTLTLWAIRGPAFPWLVRPAWATALFLYVMSAWSMALLVRRWAPNPDAAAAALSVATAVAVVAVSVAVLVTAGEATYPRERDSPMMTALRAQLEPWLVARGPQAYALHSDGTGLVPAYAGVAAIVGRTGSTPLLPGWYGRAYVPGHELDDPGPPVELVVAEGDAAVSEWEARPFATRVAASREMADGALSPAEQAVAVFAVPTGMVGRSSSGGRSSGRHSI